jgi:hypothetical protein
VVTTVAIQPPLPEFNMFSLQAEDGRNVLLNDLDPAVNGISFRIDRGSRSQLGVQGVNGLELGSQGNFDRIEILRPGTKPLGGPEASSFEVIWRITRKPDPNPTRFSLAVGDIGLFVKWISQINPVRYSQNIVLQLIDVSRAWKQRSMTSLGIIAGY